MEIFFNPTEKEIKDGVQSFISWENPMFEEGIKRAFNLSYDEVLVRIDIEKDGITGTFERKEK